MPCRSRCLAKRLQHIHVGLADSRGLLTSAPLMLLAGYYSRHAALRQLLQSFLAAAAASGQQPQVLVLGAGFDSTWFQLSHDKGRAAYKCLELDFKEVSSWVSSAFILKCTSSYSACRTCHLTAMIYQGLFCSREGRARCVAQSRTGPYRGGIARIRIVSRSLISRQQCRGRRLNDAMVGASCGKRITAATVMSYLQQHGAWLEGVPRQ